MGFELEPRRVGADEVAALAGEGRVVLATGSQPGERSYEVTSTAEVIPAGELDGGAPRGPEPGPVAIWDPIGGPIAVSIAELLVGRGGPCT